MLMEVWAQCVDSSKSPFEVSHPRFHFFSLHRGNLLTDMDCEPSSDAVGENAVISHNKQKLRRQSGSQVQGSWSGV